MREVTRSAIILFGLDHRSLKYTADTLREYVITPLEQLGSVDMFYHAWEPDDIEGLWTDESCTGIDPSSLEFHFPGARGFSESRNNFDSTLDLESLAEESQIIRLTKIDEAAEDTLKNYLRAMESQERAWQFFNENRDFVYERVVVTRSDLHFLNKLRIPASAVKRIVNEPNWEKPEFMDRKVNDPILWLPKFQSCGGLNDRFAIGSENEVGIYCRKAKFAKDCALNGKMWNPETILKEWLKVNELSVDFIDFTFQRVRADGSTPAEDLKVSAPPDYLPLSNVKELAAAEGASHQQKEKFLILAEHVGERSENLRSVFQTLGNVEIFEEGANRSDDRESGRPDPDCNVGLGDVSPKRVRRSVASHLTRALLHLSGTFDDDCALWFIDELVAGSKDTFALFVKETASKNVDLAVFDMGILEGIGRPDLRSFTDESVFRSRQILAPIFRISGRLLALVIENLKTTNNDSSLELIIYSVAMMNQMKCLGWRHSGELSRHFGIYLDGREVADAQFGINFPVRDEEVHKVICGMPPSEFPRLRRVSNKAPQISVEEYVFIKRYCEHRNISRVVEFGPGDRILPLLDAGCSITSYEPDATRLVEALDRFTGEPRLTLKHFQIRTFYERYRFGAKPDLVIIGGIPCDTGNDKIEHELCEWALKNCGHLLLFDSRKYLPSVTAADFERRGMDVIRIPTRRGLAIVTDPKMVDLTRDSLRERILKVPAAGNSWQHDDVYAWSMLFEVSRLACRILQTGASDGSAAIFMLDTIFTNAGSEVHCVDNYDGEEGNLQLASFNENAAGAARSEQLHLYEGNSTEVLAWMIATDGYWQSFDFVYLANKGVAGDLLADACQAWMLLKLGGVMFFEVERGTEAVDAFLMAYDSRVELMLEGAQVVLRKVRE